MEKVTREQIASYLNIGTKEAKDFSIIGVGITDYGQSYNPQVTTEKWIINKNATSTVESYQIQSDVSQKCYYGDPVYDYVNNLRRKEAVGSAAESEILDIDLYDSSEEGKYKAVLHACSIAITAYAKGESPAIEYTIHYNGDGIPVIVTIDKDKKVTFTPDTELATTNTEE